MPPRYKISLVSLLFATHVLLHYSFKVKPIIARLQCYKHYIEENKFKHTIEAVYTVATEEEKTTMIDVFEKVFIKITLINLNVLAKY